MLLNFHQDWKRLDHSVLRQYGRKVESVQPSITSAVVT